MIERIFTSTVSVSIDTRADWIDAIAVIVNAIAAANCVVFQNIGMDIGVVVITVCALAVGTHAEPVTVIVCAITHPRDAYVIQALHTGLAVAVICALNISAFTLDAEARGTVPMACAVWRVIIDALSIRWVAHHARRAGYIVCAEPGYAGTAHADIPSFTLSALGAA